MKTVTILGVEFTYDDIVALTDIVSNEADAQRHSIKDGRDPDDVGEEEIEHLNDCERIGDKLFEILQLLK